MHGITLNKPVTLVFPLLILVRMMNSTRGGTGSFVECLHSRAQKSRLWIWSRVLSLSGNRSRWGFGRILVEIVIKIQVYHQSGFRFKAPIWTQLPNSGHIRSTMMSASSDPPRLLSRAIPMRIRRWMMICIWNHNMLPWITMGLNFLHVTPNIKDVMVKFMNKKLQNREEINIFCQIWPYPPA